MKGKLSISILALVLALACRIEYTAPTQTPPLSQPTPDSPPTGIISPLATIMPDAERTFTLSVLVDLNSEPVTREQAQTIVDESSAILFGLTGFNMEMIAFQEVSNRGTSHVIVQEYLESAPAPLPDGVILFSFGDDGLAKTYGGFSFSAPGPAGYVSHFSSQYGHENDIYVAVIHFSHRYASCGYGESESKISDVSIDGECRNQPGTACAEKFGYSICSNAVDDLYARTPTYMASSSFVHEIMHPFGPHGIQDHYGTEECTTAMQSGISTRPYNADSFDLEESGVYTDMCPFVFDNFVNSYRP